MDDVYVVLIIPICAFGAGFLSARQYRALQNIPTISMTFVQHRGRTSAVLGLLLGSIASVTMLRGTGFSAGNILIIVAIYLIVSASCYFGIALGWGRSLPESENVIPSNQTPIDALPDNVIVDDTFDSVKITVNTQKRWGWFAMSSFTWVAMACSLPIAGLLLILVLQNYLPENTNVLIWILVGGLVLYLVYTKFREISEYIYDKEIIEIDDLSVKIEKHGLGFQSRKEYSADNIKKIVTISSFGGRNMAIKRSPFVNSNVPMFMMWHNRGLRRLRLFGRAIDLVDAQSILETVYSKFPQYRGLVAS